MNGLLNKFSFYLIIILTILKLFTIQYFLGKPGIQGKVCDLYFVSFSVNFNLYNYNLPENKRLPSCVNFNIRIRFIFTLPACKMRYSRGANANILELHPGNASPSQGRQERDALHQYSHKIIVIVTVRLWFYKLKRYRLYLWQLSLCFMELRKIN